MAITKIWALGTHGKAKGREFVARRNKDGFYVLNQKVPKSHDNQTNLAKNKIYVSTLEEAWHLLQKGHHVINLICEHNTRALRSRDSVKAEVRGS